GFGFRQFDRIDVETDKPAARLQRREQRDRMAAVAKRAINSQFAWLRSKRVDDFTNHHRPMRTGGRLAACNHFLDVGRIALRRVLLILFSKTPWTLSSVPLPTLGFFRTHAIKPVAAKRSSMAAS